MESVVGLAPIRVMLSRVEGAKIETGVIPESVAFDVDVSMDEDSRTNEELNIAFTLTISTKPTLVKYVVGGKAVVSGGKAAFDAVLEMDDEASVPKILHIIYQKVFTSLYLVASQIDCPYPPPDLLHSPAMARELEAGAYPEDQLAAEQAFQTA